VACIATAVGYFLQILEVRRSEERHTVRRCCLSLNISRSSTFSKFPSIFYLKFVDYIIDKIDKITRLNARSSSSMVAQKSWRRRHPPRRRHRRRRGTRDRGKRRDLGNCRRQGRAMGSSAVTSRTSIVVGVEVGVEVEGEPRIGLKEELDMGLATRQRRATWLISTGGNVHCDVEGEGELGIGLNVGSCEILGVKVEPMSSGVVESTSIVGVEVEEELDMGLSTWVISSGVNIDCWCRSGKGTLHWAECRSLGNSGRRESC
jgi:hypothetical protein